MNSIITFKLALKYRSGDGSGMIGKGRREREGSGREDNREGSGREENKRGKSGRMEGAGRGKKKKRGKGEKRKAGRGECGRRKVLGVGGGKGGYGCLGNDICFFYNSQIELFKLHVV